MPGRKIHDLEDAQRCLSLIHASSLTLADWCFEHQVDGRSLGAWALNLRRRSRQRPEPALPSRGRPQPALLPLKLVELRASAPASAQRYAVQHGAFVVGVGEHVDADVLRRSLQALPPW